MSAPSVMVAIPCHRHWEAQFGKCMTGLVGMTATVVERDGTLGTVGVRQIHDTYLQTARQALAETAIEDGYDWILWLDTDMTFPPDTLFHLLSRDLPIVGANYSKRSTPVGYVAIKKVVTDGDGQARTCITAPDSTGVEVVDAIGFGVTLTHTSVFASMPKPWFACEWTGSDEQIGEDVYFCRKAKEHGYDTHVDHDLSHHVGHIGSFEYECEHAWLAVPKEDRVPTKIVDPSGEPVEV